MEQSELVARIEELEREIAALPPGSIATKKVKGKEYYYAGKFSARAGTPDR